MRPLAVFACVSLSACNYDLDAISKRLRDASADRISVDVSTGDRPVTDVSADTVIDMPSTDAGTDTGPARDASRGTCALSGLNVSPAPASVNGVTVINGDTSTGSTNALPPSCQSAISANSTRVYRYEVQSGPRVVATTNPGLCGGHDTILAAYFSCDSPAGGRPVGMTNCNDDDNVNVCVACADAGVDAGCGVENSTLDLSGLVPHDIIYFVVTSYNHESTNPRGPFRLVIAENGVSPMAAPVGFTGETPANRCACPPATTPMTADVPFPRVGDSNQLSSATRLVLGARDLPFSRITGVSARLALTRYNVETARPCDVADGARAAIDLLLNTTVIASGKLGIGSGSGGFITIPFNSFAPVTFTQTAHIPLTYRIRNLEPAGSPCISLDVDLNAPNAVTLYNSNP